MDIINCTDEDLNAEINSGRPAFPELPFRIKKGSCRRLPNGRVSKGSSLMLYGEKNGARRLEMHDDDQSSVILALLNAGKLEVKSLPKADGNRSKGKTLLVNCTDENYRVAQGGRSAAKNFHIPSWQYITLPERQTRKDWPLSHAEGEIRIVDLAEHWNDVLLLTPGSKGNDVEIVGLSRVRGAGRETNPSFHAVG